MKKLATAELVPTGARPEVIARASYRLSDVHKLRQDYGASLDEVENALSKAQSQTLYGEALRTKLGALRRSGDSQQLRRTIAAARNALGQMGHFSHVRGCLGQALALSLSLTDQLAALDVLDKLDGLYADAHRLGFADHLLEALLLSRRVQIAASKGPGRNVTMAREAATRGLSLAEGRYHQIARECQSVLSEYQHGTPGPTSPKMRLPATRAWRRADPGVSEKKVA